MPCLRKGRIVVDVLRLKRAVLLQDDTHAESSTMAIAIINTVQSNVSIIFCNFAVLACTFIAAKIAQ